MSSDQTAIRVVGLSKAYHVGVQKRRKDDMLISRIVGSMKRGLKRPPRPESSTHWALRDVSLEIAQGDIVALIGSNGAGKSTLLKVLARITDPSSGFAELRGRVGALLEVGTGFHPELTGRENVFLSGAILGMRRAEIARDFDEIVAFAEVEKFIDTPVKHYSSGMHVRLAFAVATQLKPEILLIDEVLAVGDARFQRKCLQRIQDVGRGARTIIFVSHNMAAVRAICKTGIVLEHGHIVAQGEVGSVVDTYLARTNAQAAQSSDEVYETESYKLDKVTVSAGDGLLAKTFESLEIKFRITAKTEINTPNVIAKLMSSNHERIAGLDYNNFGSIGPLAAGDVRELGFRVDSLPLLPGNYFLELELKTANRKSEEVGTMFPFEVAVTPVFGRARFGLETKNGSVAIRASVMGGRID